MKKLAFIIALSLVLFVGSSLVYPSSRQISLFLIGDSTMADKPDPANNPERGWGQSLPRFFNQDVIVKNHAANGRSSKRFIDEGRWKAVLEELRPGDYVFIQFGHNDAKVDDPARYANPYSGYRRNLEKFVRETREKLAYPVLLSSVVRRNFNDSGTLVDTHGAYTFITRVVAADMGVPFIDLQLKTEDLLIELGPEKSKELYLWVKPGVYDLFPEGKQDNTHFTEKGATEVARLAAEEMIELKIPLAGFLKKGG